MTNKFNELFEVSKPMIAMLHLKGHSDEDVFSRAVREIEVYENAGVDGIVVENYFGHYYQLRHVLAYLQAQKPHLVYGVNCLNLDVLGFRLANEFDAKFVQLDSVVGHVKPRDEYSVEAFLEEERRNSSACLFGGVRFKYQPVLSEKSLAEDLRIAMKRCDAIVVTGAGTGVETDFEKIQEFRENIGNFPLIVGAGVNPANIQAQLQLCDAAIVGSYLKEGHVDTGEVSAVNVKEMVQLFKKIRREAKIDD